MLEDLHFATGGVIFGAGHDLLEKLVPRFVIEIFRRKVFVLCPKAVDDILVKGGSLAAVQSDGSG
jgi:hypothetical protein